MDNNNNDNDHNNVDTSALEGFVRRHKRRVRHEQEAHMVSFFERFIRDRRIRYYDDDEEEEMIRRCIAATSSRVTYRGFVSPPLQLTPHKRYRRHQDRLYDDVGGYGLVKEAERNSQHYKRQSSSLVPEYKDTTTTATDGLSAVERYIRERHETIRRDQSTTTTTPTTTSSIITTPLENFVRNHKRRVDLGQGYQGLSRVEKLLRERHLLAIAATANTSSSRRHHHKHHTYPSPPNTKLHQHIKSFSFPLIISRCRTHPHDAQSIDARTGTTPLHLICAIGSAPPSAISAILTAHPPAAMMTNRRYGETPLHVRCRNAQRSVGESVRILTTVRPAAARVRNHEGRTPLHVACLQNASWEVVRWLVEVAEEMVDAKDWNGDTPAVLLWMTYTRTIQGQMAMGEVRMMDDGEGHFGRFWKKMTFLTMATYRLRWSTSSSLLSQRRKISQKNKVAKATATTNNNRRSSSAVSSASSSRLSSSSLLNNDDDFNNNNECKKYLIHVIIQVDTSPVEFLKVALKLHPESCRTPDENGNLPLHLAAMMSSSSSSQSSSSSSLSPIRFRSSSSSSSVTMFNNNLNNNNKTNNTNNQHHSSYRSPRGIIIHHLLSNYPHAASTPNKQGRYPLNLALESGKTWWYEDGIADLVRATPRCALGARDATTRLLPFMAAAVGVEGVAMVVVVGDGGGEDVVTATTRKRRTTTVAELKQLDTVFLLLAELKQLDTVFLLLLEAPEFVSWGISR